MSGEKFNISALKKRILVAPLEWGLGHATRCIPIITSLLEQDCEVLIGAEGAAKELLEREFPQLVFLTLKGYRMRYSRKSYLLPLRLLLQFPKMISSIRNERRWLKKAIDEHKIDAVISDNRFGLHNPAVPCIYITHQLTIKTGNRFTQSLAQKFHYHFINKYNECWVPDAQGEVNLAGILSHPKHLPKIPVRYIGPLSRFEKITVEKKYELAVIISGPEPQRTIFEDLLLKQLKFYQGNILFVRGMPGNSAIQPGSNSNIEMRDHLNATELNKAIQESGMIISRCGYTTVMDLIKLQMLAILIPTPGQTEQEYLADHLAHAHLFCCCTQKGFSLDSALNLEDVLFPYNSFVADTNEYKKAVKEFVESLS